MTYARRGNRGYTNSRRFDFFAAIPVIGFVFVGILVVLGIGFGIYTQTVTDTITCTVTDKDRTTNSEGGSDMRVYTKDCGTLQVADSLFDGTWSSSDTYASIEPGKTYTFDTRGIRVPILSAFPNIVEVHGTN